MESETWRYLIELEEKVIELDRAITEFRFKQSKEVLDTNTIDELKRLVINYTQYFRLLKNGK